MKTSHVWKIEYSGNPLGVYVIAPSAAEALHVFSAYDTEQRWKQKQENGALPVVFSCVRVLSDVIVPATTA